MFKFNFGHKIWRYEKVIWGLCILELPLTVAILTLFGIADPDTYRTKLWLDGHNNKFNSSPSQPLYDMVNGKTTKLIAPLVWSSFLTQFNLVTSVITVFLLIVKSIVVVMHKFWPSISIVIHGAELALFAYSLHGQTSPDVSDPQNPNPGLPWYLTHNCNVATIKANIGYCMQAKAAFFVTIFFVVLFCIYLLLAVHSICFAPPKKSDNEEEKYYDVKGKTSDERQWEMVPIPETPGTAYGGSFPLSPTTPRTKAFNALEGDVRIPKMAFPPPPKKARKK